MDNGTAPQDSSTTAPTPTPYDLIGGEAGVRRLVDCFYDIMDTDPGAATIRAMHGADLGPIRQTLFEFMSGWLGGPRLYTRCVRSAHTPFSIGTAERDEWLMCMKRALANADVSAPVRKMLEQPFFAMADFMRSH